MSCTLVNCHTKKAGLKHVSWTWRFSPYSSWSGIVLPPPPQKKHTQNKTLYPELGSLWTVSQWDEQSSSTFGSPTCPCLPTAQNGPHESSYVTTRYFQVTPQVLFLMSWGPHREDRGLCRNAPNWTSAPGPSPDCATWLFCICRSWPLEGNIEQPDPNIKTPWNSLNLELFCIKM